MLLGHRKQLERLTACAEQGTLSHGYIFFGAPHIGKRACAEALANYFETGTLDPAGARPLSDARVIVPDPEKQMIGIDAIREMRNFLAQKPNASRYRTLIIDDAHTLTGEAGNALLKITEEPPGAALIILVAQDCEMLLPTIQSRLEKTYFTGVNGKEIERWLAAAHGAKKDDAARAAAGAFGAPGLAWKMLYDERFRALEASAKKFFALRGNSRRDFIKELTADKTGAPPEDAFHFDRFLEALLYASLPLTAANAPFVKACLRLRERAVYFNLNPRLQLTALAEL